MRTTTLSRLGATVALAVGLTGTALVAAPAATADDARADLTVISVRSVNAAKYGSGLVAFKLGLATDGVADISTVKLHLYKGSTKVKDITVYSPVSGQLEEEYIDLGTTGGAGAFTIRGATIDFYPTSSSSRVTVEDATVSNPFVIKYVPSLSGYVSKRGSQVKVSLRATYYNPMLDRSVGLPGKIKIQTKVGTKPWRTIAKKAVTTKGTGTWRGTVVGKRKYRLVYGGTSTIFAGKSGATKRI